MELLGLGGKTGSSIEKRKSKIKETEMWEVIKIKHSSVIPGDKYVPHHSAN
jgi:hypothetical protein